MNVTIDWMEWDEVAALREGWGLFTLDSGHVVIQKMDDPSAHGMWEEGMPEDQVFDSDAAAIRFVRKRAKAGDATASKALTVHDANYRRYRDWLRRYNLM